MTTNAETQLANGLGLNHGFLHSADEAHVAKALETAPEVIREDIEVALAVCRARAKGQHSLGNNQGESIVVAICNTNLTGWQFRAGKWGKA